MHALQRQWRTLSVCITLLGCGDGDARAKSGQDAGAPPVEAVVVSAADDSALTAQDVTVVIDVRRNDKSGGEDPAVRIIRGPKNGDALVDVNGTIHYTPKHGVGGAEDELEYALGSTSSASARAIVRIEIRPELGTIVNERLWLAQETSFDDSPRGASFYGQSSDGRVAGALNRGLPFVQQADGSISLIAALGKATWGTASDVNASGTAIGTFYDDEYNSTPFIGRPGDAMAWPGASGQPESIADDGTVVGWVLQESGEAEPRARGLVVRPNQSREFVDRSTEGSSYLTAIASNGTLLGTATAGGVQHCFTRTVDGAFIDLELPVEFVAGRYFINCTGVNRDGQIVGHAYLGENSNHRAFIVEGGSLHFLDLPFPPAPGAIERGEAVWDIDDSGNISGFWFEELAGKDDANVPSTVLTTHAFRLFPANASADTRFLPTAYSWVSSTLAKPLPSSVDVVATTDSMETARNVPVAIKVTANDVGAPTTAMFVSALEPAAHGKIYIQADGQTVRYEPARGYTGADAFSYTVRTRDGRSAQGAVQVEVLDVDATVVAGRLYSAERIDLETSVGDHAYARGIELHAINEANVAVGCAGDAPAVILADGTIELVPLVAGFVSGCLEGINDLGRAVGVFRDATDSSTPFGYDVASKLVEVWPAADAGLVPQRISNTGSTTGWTTEDPPRSFVRTNVGSLSYLLPPAGLGLYGMYAIYRGEDGAVGFSTYEEEGMHNFVRSPTGEDTEILPIPGDFLPQLDRTLLGNAVGHDSGRPRYHDGARWLKVPFPWALRETAFTYDVLFGMNEAGVLVGYRQEVYRRRDSDTNQETEQRVRIAIILRPLIVDPDGVFEELPDVR